MLTRSIVTQQLINLSQKIGVLTINTVIRLVESSRREDYRPPFTQKIFIRPIKYSVSMFDRGCW